jgi:hypothetical protein
MQYMEGSVTPVLYIGRTVLKFKGSSKMWCIPDVHNFFNVFNFLNHPVREHCSW